MWLKKYSFSFSAPLLQFYVNLLFPLPLEFEFCFQELPPTALSLQSYSDLQFSRVPLAQIAVALSSAIMVFLVLTSAWDLAKPPPSFGFHCREDVLQLEACSVLGLSEWWPSLYSVSSLAPVAVTDGTRLSWFSSFGELGILNHIVLL